MSSLGSRQGGIDPARPEIANVPDELIRTGGEVVHHRALWPEIQAGR